MKALVTGANGHLGFNLVAALVARDDFEVRASVRDRNDDAKTRPLRALHGVDVVELDVRSSEQFDAALAGIGGSWILPPAVVDEPGPNSIRGTLGNSIVAALDCTMGEGTATVLWPTEDPELISFGIQKP